MAIRWLLERENVPSVIMGVKTLKQLEDNLGAVTFKLGQEDMDRLDKASQIPPPYPYEMIDRLNVQRAN